MRHHESSSRVRQPVLMLLLLTVVWLNGIVKGLAQEKAEAPIESLDFKELVNKLASPNAPAITRNWGGEGNVKFPKGYNVGAQHRIKEVRQMLSDHFEVALPFMIAALEDKRYCMTIDWGEGDAFYNKSVGQICHEVIDSHLEVYRNAIQFTGPGHWNRYNYPAVSKEWWNTRKNLKEYELQLEAIEWAIDRFITADDDDRRFSYEEQLSDLMKLRNDIIKSKTPAKPLRLLRMATHDEGSVEERGRGE